MSILTAQEIKERGRELIVPFDEKNVTSQGYDVTVSLIEQMQGPGELRVAGKELPEYQHASFRLGTYYLGTGQYLVTFNEEVSIPEDMCAFLWSRSTLLRMGASLQTAVWDAGYHGIGSSLILVSNPMGIHVERGARIGQLVFHRLGESTEKPYDGQYQGGKKR